MALFTKMSKLIVVFGATGKQGGSVVRALQGDKAFKVRGITRNVESPKAKALVESGVEMVVADQDDLASLNKAFSGAYGVFGVTNWWEHFDSAREIKQGKNIADAAKSNDVKHVVFSGLENLKEMTGREVPFYDNKSIIEDHMKQIGVPFTSARFAFFFENFFAANKPRKEGDNNYVLDIPLGGLNMDGQPTEETGEVIHQIFARGDEYIGKVVGIASYSAPVSTYAEILTKHLDGKTFTAGKITVEEFRGLGFPGADILANMFQALHEGKVKRDVALTKSLYPGIPDFDAWVQKNKEAILKALD